MNSELLAPAPADISVPRVEAAGLSAAACRKLTALFLLLLLAGATAGVVVPAGPGWDFANFYDTGRRVAAGQVTDIYDPETLIDGERPQGDMRFWGTPVSALLYAPLGYLQPLTALAVFKIQNTLALFAALVLLYLHNRKFVDDTPEAQWRFAALFAFLCLVFQPFWTIYRVGGQTTPTVFLLLVLGLLCHARSKVFLSALCVVAAVLIKPAFVTVLALLALISGLRFAGGTAVVLLASGLVSLATVGWAVHEDFLTLMLKGTSAPFPW
ncbi:MAG: glycosyltransferase 87 family protein, partial [Pyrinomonadaceae bacterium]